MLHLIWLIPLALIVLLLVITAKKPSRSAAAAADPYDVFPETYARYEKLRQDRKKDEEAHPSSYTLAQVARDTHDTPSVRIAAINKLSSAYNKYDLERIAEDTHDNSAVRAAAASKLNG